MDLKFRKREIEIEIDSYVLKSYDKLFRSNDIDVKHRFIKYFIWSFEKLVCFSIVHNYIEFGFKVKEG